jgi:hypothetical protein
MWVVVMRLPDNMAARGAYRAPSRRMTREHLTWTNARNDSTSHSDALWLERYVEGTMLFQGYGASY